MKVTRFNYPLEKTLIVTLNRLCERCTTKRAKKDAVLNIEGKEGEGKSTLSVAIGYYVAEKTKREFSSKNMYFDADKLLKDAQETKEQIFIWDEPALSALSRDHHKRVLKDLTRLLLMARKKRHFFIFNLARFTNFNKFLVFQRPLGMIHVYSRNDIIPGRFCYIPQKYLEALWRDWVYKKRRNYQKYSLNKIRGSFPPVLEPTYKNNVLSEFDINDYETRKDKAILRVGKDDKKKINKWKKKYDNLKYQIGTIHKRTNVKQKDIVKGLDCTKRTLQNWGKKARES